MNFNPEKGLNAFNILYGITQILTIIASSHATVPCFAEFGHHCLAGHFEVCPHVDSESVEATALLFEELVEIGFALALETADHYVEEAVGFFGDVFLSVGIAQGLQDAPDVIVGRSAQQARVYHRLGQIGHPLDGGAVEIALYGHGLAEFREVPADSFVGISAQLHVIAVIIGEVYGTAREHLVDVESGHY